MIVTLAPFLTASIARALPIPLDPPVIWKKKLISIISRKATHKLMQISHFPDAQNNKNMP